MLNAFRHLRSIHSSFPFLRLSPYLCSTPFGISDPFTRRDRRLIPASRSAQRLSASQIHSRDKPKARSIRCDECSTPFGISDPFTIGLLDALFISVLCSTPFGISDPFTPWAGTTPQSSRCAQRLSASQIHSRRKRVIGLKFSMCSTPFGISDPFTHFRP